MRVARCKSGSCFRKPPTGTIRFRLYSIYSRMFYQLSYRMWRGASGAIASHNKYATPHTGKLRELRDPRLGFAVANFHPTRNRTTAHSIYVPNEPSEVAPYFCFHSLSFSTFHMLLKLLKTGKRVWQLKRGNDIRFHCHPSGRG